MVAIGDRYQRTSDSSVHEVVKLMLYLSPPRGVLLGGTVGAWTVTEVTGAQLAANYVPFVDPVVVDDVWRDRDNPNNIYRIASLFTADAVGYVALDPVDPGGPITITVAALQARGQKVV